MRNCGWGAAILAAALVWQVGCERKSAVDSGPGNTVAGNPSANAPAGGAPAGGAKRKIRFVFKVSGLSYGAACEKGMREAADKLGIDAQFLAPDTADALRQINMIEDQVTAKADAVVISPNDAGSVKKVIADGLAKGTKMFTWDSDAPESRRLFYVAAADDVQIGVDIADALAKSVGGKGKVAVMSGGRAAYNLNQHVKGILQGLKKYPGITVVQPILYNDDDKTKAISQATAVLQQHPDLVGFAGANSPSPPGAAQALIKTGRAGKVKVWGLSLPSENKEYIKKDIVTGLMLWDPAKLTGLTTILVNDYLDGKPPKDGAEYPGYGKISVKGPLVLMPGVTITKANIDQFNF